MRPFLLALVIIGGAISALPQNPARGGRPRVVEPPVYHKWIPVPQEEILEIVEWASPFYFAEKWGALPYVTEAYILQVPDVVKIDFNFPTADRWTETPSWAAIVFLHKKDCMTFVALDVQRYPSKRPGAPLIPVQFNGNAQVGCKSRLRGDVSILAGTPLGNISGSAYDSYNPLWKYYPYIKDTPMFSRFANRFRLAAQVVDKAILESLKQRGLAQ